MQQNENVTEQQTVEEQTTTQVETTEDNVEVTNKIKDVNEVIAYLAEQFPKCFSIKGEAKPIKIGIFKDLAERVDQEGRVSRTVLRTALRKYTSSWRYLESIQPGAKRVDIDGNEVEDIEQEHVEHAKATLAESKQKAAEKRKQRAPRRDKRPNDGANKPKGAKLNIKRSPKGKAVDVKVKKRRTIDTGIFEGKQVLVSMGRAPIEGTIKEINGDDVVVVTNTGFTVKTEKSKIVK
ncbi:RNA chaperone ProQ [Saccharobesus litoralis]|uniref:RNA chaperone ProQ n=1 Tax=Saccharobesus litoralis TaxID=2172099 RepID=A0A2S0VU51_9ALTE|nr:RNA chaperone ProQ [Saccharobesus litoralis]AWB67735.1 RNA chaperone ProQ [Saccharobesus litoralis]